MGETAPFCDEGIEPFVEVITAGVGVVNSPCARIDNMTSISPLGSTPLLSVTAPRPARTDLSRTCKVDEWLYSS